jgi:hypothetical protein
MMDVSGSMGPWHKEMSKRFYILLYLFLTRNYDKVDVVFIRHHHTAQEVDEETFFTSRESGGTVVSTAMDLMRDIARERYPTSQWNIYACHASDGDNFLNDNAKVYDRLMNDIMPIVQYYAYVEVDKQDTSQLWQVYEDVHRAHEHFAMARITDAGEIFPVFRGLFERQGEGVPNG